MELTAHVLLDVDFDFDRDLSLETDKHLYLANDTIQVQRIWSSFSTCPYPFATRCLPAGLLTYLYILHYCTSKTMLGAAIFNLFTFLMSKGPHIQRLNIRAYIYARIYTQKNLYLLEYCIIIDTQTLT